MATLTVLALILLTSTLTILSSSSSLDPKQLIALQSIGLPTKLDPCTANLTSCDSSSPFRHLISLTLKNCSSDIEISSTALRSLSTLHSLSFLNCPLPLFKHPLPSSLSSSLSSFSSVSSLKHLTGVWLSHLKNLTHLNLIDVPISTSGAFVFLSQMPLLQTAVVSGCNLSGRIPHRWHSFNLTHLDLSQNNLTGNVHSSINVLTDLIFLNLSSNALSGVLPESLGDLSSLKNASFSSNSFSGSLPESIKEMTDLVHLDLSSNQFNGSLPKFLEEMTSLKHLNLESNSFQGVMPFNASFIKRLEVFKVGGNSNLCYNHTLLSSKLKLGIAPCDKYGMPVLPPPVKTDKSNGGDEDGSEGDNVDEDDGGESRKSSEVHHGPNRFVLVVAIGLAVLVFLVIFCICISKCCR